MSAKLLSRSSRSQTTKSYQKIPLLITVNKTFETHRQTDLLTNQENSNILKGDQKYI